MLSKNLQKLGESGYFDLHYRGRSNLLWMIYLKRLSTVSLYCILSFNILIK